MENLEDLALPEETEEPEENAQEKPCRGKGRSEAWLLKRKREQALAGLQLCMEKSELHTCSRKDAVKEFLDSCGYIAGAGSGSFCMDASECMGDGA